MLLTLSPDAAAIGFTLGLAAIGFECNRPGSILPGALGLLTSLLAAASLYRDAAQPIPAALLAAGVLLVLVRSRRSLPAWTAAVAIALLVLGWRTLLPAAKQISWPAALLCGVLAGSLGWWSTGIALRARRAKGHR